MAKLDVILTYYGQPAYLDRCLASVAAQDFHDLEVHVIDDFSNEPASSVVEKWRRQIKLKHYRSDKNLGSLLQIQRMYSLTSAPYVVILNHDDEWHSDFLATTFENGLLKNPGCSFSSSLYCSKIDGEVVDATNHLVASRESGIHNFLFHIIFSNWFQFSFTIFRREAFDAVGGFDRIVAASSIGKFDKNRLLAGDSYSWARLSTVGPAFFVNKRCGTKRYHSESFGARYKELHLEEVISFNQRVFADVDIFEDDARYFSLLVILSRLTQGKSIFAAAEDLFEKSLFSDPQYTSKRFVNMRPKMLRKIVDVLDDFRHDFSGRPQRKILKPGDKKRYELLMQGMG